MACVLPPRRRIPIPGPVLVLVAVLLPGVVGAQEEVVPLIHGEVRAGEAPLPGAMVVLHQVSSEMSGEIDSIRAGNDGTFQLRLPRVPDHGVRSEVYFASVRYQGLLYFGPAITAPAQLDSLYLIQAFDTLSVPEGGAALPIAVRNLFLDKAEEGWEVTDFFQVQQEGARTLYSPGEGVTWRYPLPPSARDFEVGQGDLAPDAIRFQDGWMELYAPIPPGDRFFLVRYRVSRDDLTIPLPGSTGRMEVLVRTPGPDAAFPPLSPAGPVELDPGNVFDRYVGDQLRDTEVRAQLVEGGFEFRAEWLGLILAALLGGAGVFAYRFRRAGGGSAPEATRGTKREQVLMEIARLDEEFHGQSPRTDGARAAYLARREALLSRLKELP